MGMTITDKQIAKLRKAFDANPANKVAQNAVTSVQLPDLTLNRNNVQEKPKNRRMPNTKENNDQ